MNNKASKILPIIVLAVVLSPVAASLLKREEAPMPAPVARAPDPKPAPRQTDPAAWFDAIQSRCTPADVTLATDLNRPPAGVEGTGYEAACFALAHRVPKARALLLGLPDADRLRGASLVYDVAQRLAAEDKHDTAGPLMELVLEFWPNHYMALYEAGAARFASGDLNLAQDYLARFLEIYVGNDDLVSNAHRMMTAAAER